MKNVPFKKNPTGYRAETLAIMGGLLVGFSPSTMAQSNVSMPIWTDGFANGWFSWVQGQSVTKPVKIGTNALRLGKGLPKENGYVFANFSRLSTIAYTDLEFWIHGGETGGQEFRITAGITNLNGEDKGTGKIALLTNYLFDANGQKISAVPANEWAKVKVPLSAIGADKVGNLYTVSMNGGANGEWWQGEVQNSCTIDDLRFTGPAPAKTASIQVDASKLMPISIPQSMFGANVGYWALQTEVEQGPRGPELMREAGLTAFRAHLGNPGNGWAINKWDFTGDNGGIAKFGNIIAGVPNSVGYLSFNAGTGSAQQSAALLAYTNLDKSSPAYVQDRQIGSATEYYLTNPVDGEQANPVWSSRERDWKSVRFWVDLRASQPLLQDDGLNALRVGRSQPWKFQYFELGNEAWLARDGGTKAPPFEYDAEKYGQLFVASYKLMKQLDPSAKIGIHLLSPQENGGGIERVEAENPTTGRKSKSWTTVLLRTLRDQNVMPDWISDHNYVAAPDELSTLQVDNLETIYNWRIRGVEYRQRINEYFNNFPQAARDAVEVHVTETNWPVDDWRITSSIPDALLFATSFGNLLQSENKNFMWFTWRSGQGRTGRGDDPYRAEKGFTTWRDYGDWGMVGNKPDANNPRPDYFLNVKLPNFFASKLVKQFARPGDTVVRYDGLANNNPFISVFACKRQDGSLALLMVNKARETDITANIALQGFQPRGVATMYSYGKAQDEQQKRDTAATGTTVDLQKQALGKVGSTFKATIPAYSIGVVEVQ